MIYELSRDYAHAWELIQKDDRLACEVDCRLGRDVGSAYNWKSRVTIISQPSVNYAWLADEENTFEIFAEKCTELNIKFYLPLPADTMVMSAELFEEVAREVVKKSIGDPLDELIKKVESVL